jgi:hypothetical protein
MKRHYLPVEKAECPKRRESSVPYIFFTDSVKILYEALSMNIVKKIVVAAILIQNKPYFT